MKITRKSTVWTAISCLAVLCISGGIGCSSREFTVRLTEEMIQESVQMALPLSYTEYGGNELPARFTIQEVGVSLAAGSDRASVTLNIKVESLTKTDGAPSSTSSESELVVNSESSELEKAALNSPKPPPLPLGDEKKTGLPNPAQEFQFRGQEIKSAVKNKVPPPLAETVNAMVSVSSKLLYRNETGEFFIEDVRVEEVETDKPVPAAVGDLLRPAISKVASDYFEHQAVYQLNDVDFASSTARSLLKSLQIQDGYLVVSFGYPN